MEKVHFTKYQKFIVGILAIVQFSIVLDFMILAPLGAILMPALQISPAQFGFVVSAYAFSAGISGLLAAGFSDRFDRKKLLMFFYTGFIVGTFLCATATTYVFLLVARIVTGVFGGVMASIVFAIVTDLFPFEVRGRVMGVIQSAFGASQVLGIPVALFLSNHLTWHAPFMLVVGVSILVLLSVFFLMKPVDAHLKLKKLETNAFLHFVSTLSNKRYVQSFATTALLATGGFMIMPFSSAFNVHNLGISLEQLPWVFMITGISSMLAGPLIGKLTDRFGKFNVFCVGAFVSIVMVAIYTRLGLSSFGAVVLINVVLFLGISARMISSSALISAIPAHADRGAFMAVSSSIQQISGGFASSIAGFVVVETATGQLLHFDHLGDIVIGATLFTTVMMYFIHKRVQWMARSSHLC